MELHCQLTLQKPQRNYENQLKGSRLCRPLAVVFGPVAENVGQTQTSNAEGSQTQNSCGDRRVTEGVRTLTTLARRAWKFHYMCTSLQEANGDVVASPTTNRPIFSVRGGLKKFRNSYWGAMCRSHRICTSILSSFRQYFGN